MIQKKDFEKQYWVNKYRFLRHKHFTGIEKWLSSYENFQNFILENSEGKDEPLAFNRIDLNKPWTDENVIIRLYRSVHTGGKLKKDSKEVIQQREEQRKKMYKEVIYAHLLRYGNTVVSTKMWKDKKDKILEYLEGKGMDAKVRFVPARDGMSAFYVLEVLKWTPMMKSGKQ